MSLKVKITKDKLQQGRLIPNGWYSGEVSEVSDDTDKNGNDMATVDIKVTGHPEFQGVPVRTWMSPEWGGGGDFMRRYIEAITGKPYLPEQEVDLGATKGRKIKFFNQSGTDQNGKPCNSISDWSHIDKAVT